MKTLQSAVAKKKLTADAQGNFTLDLASGKYFQIGTKRVYFYTTAITANSTTTTTAAGSFAITSNATGLGSIFRSDGTKWQYLTEA